MRLVLVLLGALLLGGCLVLKTEQRWDEQMASFVGRDISEIIVGAGPPTQTVNLPNGSVMYSWTKSSMVSDKQVLPDYAGGLYVRDNSQRYSCTSNFVVNPNTQRVVSYSFQGNYCKY
jgi:hypothetical protein